jgi:hypothetical protein
MPGHDKASAPQLIKTTAARIDCVETVPISEMEAEQSWATGGSGVSDVLGACEMRRVRGWLSDCCAFLLGWWLRALSWGR